MARTHTPDLDSCETAPPAPTDLTDMLDRLESATEGESQVSTALVVNAIGRRSFGALLLVPGLVTVAPVIGDVPGVPTLMAALLLLVAAQLVLKRECLWLPDWLLKRSVARSKVCRVIGWLRPVARFIDRLSRRRLAAMTHGLGAYTIALACLLIGLALPTMEFIPFTANGAGAAIMLFGLALISHDGLLAIIGLVIMVATLGAVSYGAALAF